MKIPLPSLTCFLLWYSFSFNARHLMFQIHSQNIIIHPFLLKLLPIWYCIHCCLFSAGKKQATKGKEIEHYTAKQLYNCMMYCTTPYCTALNYTTLCMNSLITPQYNITKQRLGAQRSDILGKCEELSLVVAFLENIHYPLVTINYSLFCKGYLLIFLFGELFYRYG